LEQSDQPLFLVSIDRRPRPGAASVGPGIRGLGLCSGLQRLWPAPARRKEEWKKRRPPLESRRAGSVGKRG